MHFPRVNAHDVKEFEQELGGKIKIVYVETMDEVLKLALVRSPFDGATAKKATTKKNTKTVSKKAAEKKAVPSKKKKK